MLRPVKYTKMTYIPPTINFTHDAPNGAAYELATNQIFIDASTTPEMLEYRMNKEIGAAKLYQLGDYSPFPNSTIGLELASHEYAMSKTDPTTFDQLSYDSYSRDMIAKLAMSMNEEQYVEWKAEHQAEIKALFDKIDK